MGVMMAINLGVSGSSRVAMENPTPTETAKKIIRKIQSAII
jgi:hypothetical protein